MSKIIEEAKIVCASMLSTRMCSNYHFHNLQHTLEVCKSARLIAEAENITAEEKEIVSIAALFHDTGYSQIYKGHEEISMQIAEEFLTLKNCNNDYLLSVLKCIAATKMPQQPESNLEKIICDADLAHLSATNYLQRIALLREEWSCFLGMKFSDEEWRVLNIEFLANHRYHTNFGSTVLEQNKLKNLLLLEQGWVPNN
ncbi:HD domain-containing protein [Gillisia sp. Hel_I_86]|uniref:HD domain-containing protein n=1 Tax=Gillisia sp. Hel_I_86 TaxID=1249981 RepID=UPI00119C38A2|nr:HD domain-containing protein [Gillisia sp. Hel_I_86]TVZ27693.1 HD domain-containing protein [Gillisia sp. Hel_I_86]